MYDNYDRVWFGTPKGICSYDGQEWKKHKLNKKRNRVQNLFIDTFDNKWICTNKSIIVYNLEGVEFKNNKLENEKLIVSK